MNSRTALTISGLLTCLLVLAGDTFAQVGLKPHGRARSDVRAKPQNGTSRELQLRLRACELAAETADEALKWDDKDAAVRVLAQAADLLWANYPSRALAWLTRAWEMTDAVTGEDTDHSARRFRSTSLQPRARATVLAVAQRHDPQLANHWLDQLTDEVEQSHFNARRGIFDDRTARSEQLLNLALAMVESDPASAADLAERSLGDGISFQLQSLLLALWRRDKAIANRVFDAALNRLASGATNASEVLVLASYLFTPGSVMAPRRDRTTALAVGTQTPVLPRPPADDDPVRARHFLTVMQQGLLSRPMPATTPNPALSAQEYVTLAGSLMNGFKLYAPELWPPVGQRMALVMPDLPPASSVREDDQLSASVREKLRSGSNAGADEQELNRLYAEGLAEAAEQETDLAARKLAFVNAALATSPDELEQGRGLAARIDEVDLREQVVSFLVYRTALMNLEKGQLENAVKLITEVTPLQRSLVLITAAQRLSATRSKTDRAQALASKFQALEFLAEAERLLARDDLPSAALRLRLGLIAALASLDQQRALEAFGNVVTAINNDSAFDITDTSAPRLAYLAGAADSSLPRIRTGYGLKDAVTLLARTDFDDITLMAAKLSSPAVRGTCMLEIARSILSAEVSR